jgi:hypothetical protein
VNPIEPKKIRLLIVEDHPLDGIGFSGLANVLPQIGEELGLQVKDSAHNTFLRMLAELGIFGLAAFLFVWVMCWRLAVKGVRTAASRFDRQLSVGLGGMAIALALSCAFGDRFFGMSLAWRWHGPLPLPALSGGLIEGVAEAASSSDPDEDATIHEQARAMIEAGLAPPLAAVMGAGFSTQAGRRAGDRARGLGAGRQARLGRRLTPRAHPAATNLTNAPTTARPGPQSEPETRARGSPDEWPRVIR